MTLLFVTMAPFLRIAFSSYDLGVLPPLADPPFCAIKLKEALITGEELILKFDHQHYPVFNRSYHLCSKGVTSVLFPVLKNVRR